MESKKGKNFFIIVKRIKGNKNELKKFKQELLKSDDKKAREYIMNYPIVYIYVTKNGNKYDIYVGESNDIFRRTKQHYQNIEKEWKITKDTDLYIIGCELFNKSMTLDIESKLINYFLCVKNANTYNSNFNPQNHYYDNNMFNEVFSKIWRKLRNEYDKELFPTESQIKESALFKASPLHKLTEEQEDAKDKIIEKILNEEKANKKGQLVFVEGETGTGKTVLISSLFYELINMKKDGEEKKYYLLVNHNEQKEVYDAIASKLGLGKGLIYKPTNFINEMKKNTVDLADVVLIDEAHLLFTQGNQGYNGKNQLEDILKLSKIVVVMFDENQIMNAEDYWENIDSYRRQAKKQNSYIKLKEQLRIKANKYVIDWIDSFTKEGLVKELPKKLGKYDIKFFETPSELEKAIKEKASKEKTRLSRLIATYDWEYKEAEKPKDCKYWEVEIETKNGKEKWHMPWNYQLKKNKDEKVQKLSWIERPETINEVGSTYTIQGFDLNYSGVILGPSVKYESGHIVFHPEESHNKKATRSRTLSDGSKKKFAKDFLKHEVRVLMTRGVNGLYIYACDDELRKRLEECSKIN